MDTAQMFPEGFPVSKGSWVLEAAIQPDPRAEEPRVGVGHLNKAVGQLLFSEPPPTSHCETIVISSRGAPFCWFEVFVLGMQAKGDVPTCQ